MAACDGLRIFEKPLPLASLSQWEHVKSVDRYSFTEIFGQLSSNENAHVLDSIESSPSSSPFPSSFSSSSSTSTSVFTNDEHGIHHYKKQHQRSDSISSVNSESVSTCTEELGFESSDDVDQDLLKNDNFEQRAPTFTRTKDKRCSRRNNRSGSFPPPISCIGRNGKPWVCFETVREGGRFILTEIRIPTQEFLHACRKNGRLKMQFIHSDDEFLDEDEEDTEKNAEEDDYEGMSEIEDGDTQATGV